MRLDIDSKEVTSISLISKLIDVLKFDSGILISLNFWNTIDTYVNTMHSLLDIDTSQLISTSILFCTHHLSHVRIPKSVL